MEKNEFSLATKYEVDTSFDNERFIKLRIKVCHDGENYNWSSLSLEAMNAAKDTLKNIPILAHVIFDDDGKPQFGGHDIHLDIDPTGEEDYRIVYEEIPIGVVPETNNYSVETCEGKNYVFVDAYVWREYSNIAEYIIERDQEIKVSMEIKVNKYETTVNSPVIDIVDYKYCAITLLGNQLETGMKNTKAVVVDFAKTATDKFSTLQTELSNVLEHSDTQKFNKEVNAKKMEEKKALINQYGIKIEDLEFDVESLGLEELKSKLEEFKCKPKDEKDKKKSEKKSEDEKKDSEDEVKEPEEDPEEDDKKCKEKHSKKSDYEKLYKELTEEFEGYKSEHSFLNTEFEKLQEFKNKTLIDEILKNFSDLENIEEFEKLKAEAYTFDDLEALENKCYVIRGKNISYLNSKNKNTYSNKGSVNTAINKNKDSSEPYGGIFAEFGFTK